MANYCTNSLMLNEDSNDSILDVLKDYLNKNGHLSFELILPVPNELRKQKIKPKTEKKRKELIKKYGADSAWDWCVMNWGTKYDCEVFDSYEEYNNRINFTTPWSPPIGIVKTLSMLTGREFRLTYIEEGMDFCGEYFSYPLWLQNHDHEHSPIKSAPKKLKKELQGDNWNW
jgi:hypothetical protein